MRARFDLVALLPTALLCGPASAIAGGPVAPEVPPTAWAARADKAPTVDGDVLGDAAWAAAPPLVDFWQTAPSEGAPASEPTEVRILYTSGTLYFGVVCRDAARHRRARPQLHDQVQPLVRPARLTPAPLRLDGDRRI